MDSEFVNVFISKQKQWIEELVAKHLMLETRVHLAEQKLVEKSKEIQSLKEEIESKNHFINNLVETNSQKDAELQSLQSNELVGTKKKSKQQIQPEPQEEVNDF